SPATNAGANKVLTLAFYSQNSSLVYDTNEISNRFNSVEEKILSNSSNINSLQKSQEIYDFVGETATGESLNGATISPLNQTITIPTGIAGGSTYLQKRMILANYPAWAVGHKIMFVFIINENIANASDNILGVNVSAFRNGSIVQNQGLNISFARINSTKLKFWCEYTIQTGDTQIIPTIQINSNPA
ncbi:hypothetical protein, partial [Emticicia sp. W12TSBA100-4]|uniref:hypothetical protein n=1 Tax=Emticicia sp. W12TSBA100-4 TaxID=3160965 RepID=UPI003305DA6B